MKPDKCTCEEHELPEEITTQLGEGDMYSLTVNPDCPVHNDNLTAALAHIKAAIERRKTTA